MFSRNAFLVDIVGVKSGRVLKLNSISSGDLWKTADVLIFDSWHWWLHTGRKQPYVRYTSSNYTHWLIISHNKNNNNKHIFVFLFSFRWDIIQDMNNTYKDMNRLVAYSKALNTWAKWVNSNVDNSKTKVIFRGISPDHMK